MLLYFSQSCRIYTYLYPCLLVLTFGFHDRLQYTVTPSLLSSDDEILPVLILLLFLAANRLLVFCSDACVVDSTWVF